MFGNLDKCLLFKGLTTEKISDLLHEVTFKEKSFSKNETIAYCDDEVRSLLIIIKGSVRGEMVDFSGKTIKIEDIEPPRMLAPAFLYGKNNRYPVDIVANQQSVVLSLSKPAFINLLQSDQQILTNYLNSISNRAQFLSTKIRFLSFQTIKGKIAHFLLQLSQRNNSIEFVLPKSQNELAEMFGVARPSLGRAIREMDAEGIIKADGKQVKILDKQRLSGLLKG
jgi:CRP/FNR family transcriptional regulator, dissimilatory nitrate respiration regulator